MDLIRYRGVMPNYSSWVKNFLRVLLIRRRATGSREEHAEHVLDGPPAHRAGVRGGGAHLAEADVHARIAGDGTLLFLTDDARVPGRPRRPGAPRIRRLARRHRVVLGEAPRGV